MDDIGEYDEPDINDGFAEGPVSRHLHRVLCALAHAQFFGSIYLDDKEEMGHWAQVSSHLDDAYGSLEDAEAALGDPFIPRGPKVPDWAPPPSNNDNCPF